MSKTGTHSGLPVLMPGPRSRQTHFSESEVFPQLTVPDLTDDEKDDIIYNKHTLIKFIFNEWPKVAPTEEEFKLKLKKLYGAKDADINFLIKYLDTLIHDESKDGKHIKPGLSSYGLKYIYKWRFERFINEFGLIRPQTVLIIDDNRFLSEIVRDIRFNLMRKKENFFQLAVDNLNKVIVTPSIGKPDHYKAIVVKLDRFPAEEFDDKIRKFAKDNNSELYIYEKNQFR